MKTTIDIAEPLARKAKALAAERGTTLRSLVEEGLRHVIEEHERRPHYRMEDCSAGRGGLRPEVQDLSWQEIVDLSYEGRDA